MHDHNCCLRPRYISMKGKITRSYFSETRKDSLFLQLFRLRAMKLLTVSINRGCHTRSFEKLTSPPHLMAAEIQIARMPNFLMNQYFLDFKIRENFPKVSIRFALSYYWHLGDQAQAGGIFRKCIIDKTLSFMLELVK